MNLKLIRLLIQDLGFDVHYAVNGREAIEFLEKNEPDLVLCDIQMPEIDGIGVLKFIRQNLPIEKTKVIALTAHALVGDREKFIKMGFDNYISKPFDTREFRQLMMSYKSMSN